MDSKLVKQNTFVTTNPANNQVLVNYTYITYEAACLRLEQVQQTFLHWKKYSYEERAQVLLKIADQLKVKKEAIAELMHFEMGKLMTEARAEVDKSIQCCEYYAQNAKTILNPQLTASNYKSSTVHFAPLGVVLSIMPWNFPLWQFVRFAAPALMAGNAIAMKHSDLTAGVAQLIEEIFNFNQEPRRPLVANLCIDHAVCAKIIAHDLVRGVTFTGSTRGGREVATTAAQNLKKTVLELGGSDAYLVLADADLDLAAEVCARARLMNSGQSCVAAKRFIVAQEIINEFTQKLSAQMHKFTLAPLAHKKFALQLHSQVQKLIAAGGDLLLGGQLPDGPGAYYPATLVRFEKHPQILNEEELFGPVAVVIKAQNLEQMIEFANATKYGLGGAVFSRELLKAQEIALNDLQAGFIAVNDQVKSDPRIPFGGVKDSGYGRELGVFGIMEFVNVKTVAVGG